MCISVLILIISEYYNADIGNQILNSIVLTLS